jgi:small subunit ribosomal protein S13
MRIAGAEIPDNKRVEIALTYLFGIGRSRAGKILKTAGISVSKRTKELSAEELNKIRGLIEKYPVEADLRREISSNIKRLRDIKSYRGVRHMRHLPARGQRTKTNSRTVRPYRGRKTMTSGRRKLEKK